MKEVGTLPIQIAAMEPRHYWAALDLLRQSEGVVLRDVDEREAVERYLERNPRLSLIATEDDCLVGTTLCGHDGRRGYLYHLAVAKSHRGRGIGSALVMRCLHQLGSLGIVKVHIDVIS